MPIYEYECTSCHHHFDLMQKITAEPVTQCPACFSNSVVKLVSAAGFQLKGTGWYATDFKSKNTATPNNSDKKEDTSKTSETATQDNSAVKSTAKAAKAAKGDSE